ncbi:MAG: sugar synthetase, partial [candidate division WOR-3 bacterium]
PAVVLYMVSELTYWLGRIVLKIPYISLPNIVLKRKVYPEFVQHIKPESVAEKVLEMYGRKEEFSALSKEISKLLKGKYDEVEVLKEILRL